MCVLNSECVGADLRAPRERSRKCDCASVCVCGCVFVCVVHSTRNATLRKCDAVRTANLPDFEIDLNREQAGLLSYYLLS